MRGWRTCFVLVLLALYTAGEARADETSRRARQLRGAGEYKVRMSAALGLAKTRDPRAIVAMTYALRSDRNGTVRRVAALSLGKMVDTSTPEKVRRRAVRALEISAKRDRDRRVRRNARGALESLRGLRAPANASVFVNIARPADRTRRAPRSTEAQLHRALHRTLRKYAPTFATGSGRSVPTRDQLERRGMRGFYVKSSISEVRVRRRGRRAQVKCSVSLRVSPWEGRDGKERLVAGKAASASGSGKVVGSSSRRGILSSLEQCVLAVAEQVTVRQVVPFLRRVVASR